MPRPARTWPASCGSIRRDSASPSAPRWRTSPSPSRSRPTRARSCASAAVELALVLASHHRRFVAGDDLDRLILREDYATLPPVPSTLAALRRWAGHAIGGAARAGAAPRAHRGRDLVVDGARADAATRWWHSGSSSCARASPRWRPRAARSGRRSSWRSPCRRRAPRPRPTFAVRSPARRSIATSGRARWPACGWRRGPGWPAPGATWAGRPATRSSCSSRPALSPVTFLGGRAGVLQGGDRAVRAGALRRACRGRTICWSGSRREAPSRRRQAGWRPRSRPSATCPAGPSTRWRWRACGSSWPRGWRRPRRPPPGECSTRCGTSCAVPGALAAATADEASRKVLVRTLLLGRAGTRRGRGRWVAPPAGAHLAPEGALRPGWG